MIHSFVEYGVIIITTGLPSIIRADLGTENTTIACIHPFLRRHGVNGSYSFRYGRSVSNQVGVLFTP